MRSREQCRALDMGRELGGETLVRKSREDLEASHAVPKQMHFAAGRAANRFTQMSGKIEKRHLGQPVAQAFARTAVASSRESNLPDINIEPLSMERMRRIERIEQNSRVAVVEAGVVLQTLQQLMGSHTPVLMDIATAANFPCQQPFSEHLGVAQLPQYRIMPDHKQTAASSNGWQAGEAGGPFLVTQAMLYTSTIATYLSGDWYRDWGSVEQYHRLVPADQAPDAVVEQGVMTVRGWSRQGPIRALP